MHSVRQGSRGEKERERELCMEMLNVGDDHGMRWLNQPIRNNANIDLAEIVFFPADMILFI